MVEMRLLRRKWTYFCLLPTCVNIGSGLWSMRNPTALKQMLFHWQGTMRRPTGCTFWLKRALRFVFTRQKWASCIVNVYLPTVWFVAFPFCMCKCIKNKRETKAFILKIKGIGKGAYFMKKGRTGCCLSTSATYCCVRLMCIVFRKVTLLFYSWDDSMV